MIYILVDFALNVYKYGECESVSTEFSYEDKLLEIYGKILNFKTILTLIKLVFFSNNKTLTKQPLKKRYQTFH